MASINQFLKALGPGDSIKDYSHASKIFVSDNFRLSPKYGFIFHVAIDVNPEVSRTERDRILEMGMMVKSAALPKFSVDSKTMNSYNRVNIVQNKIKYDPVTITFHDDSADVVRHFWYDYYSYYYRDSDYQQSVYSSAHKYSPRQSNSWGYSPRSYPNSQPGTQQFLRGIRIYSLHQKRFSEYTLINPTITAFRHGDHVNGNNELMQHEMTVAFETVKYAFGYVSKNTISGFAELHYDHRPSPLTPAGGGTKSILGPGGLLNTIDEVTTDLADGNYFSAAFKTARGLQNFKGADLKRMAGRELTNVGIDILRGNNPLSKVNVPSISNLANKATASLGSFTSLGAANQVRSNGEKIGSGAGTNVSTQNTSLPPVNDDDFFED